MAIRDDKVWIQRLDGAFYVHSDWLGLSEVMETLVGVENIISYHLSRKTANPQWQKLNAELEILVLQKTQLQIQIDDVRQKLSMHVADGTGIPAEAELIAECKEKLPVAIDLMVEDAVWAKRMGRPVEWVALSESWDVDKDGDKDVIVPMCWRRRSIPGE